MRDLAIRAEELMKELDKIEAAERNLNIKPATYVIGVTQNGVMQKFAFDNQVAMIKFINSIGRAE